MAATESFCLDLFITSDLLLRLRRFDQNLLDPLVLPPLRRDPLVPMGISIRMVHRGTLFPRGHACRNF